MSQHRVLLIEDDADVRDVVSAMLADLGFTAVARGSVEEAVDQLSGGERFDVIVTDVVMPGTSGLELTALVRRWQPRTPIVLITGKLDGMELAVRKGYVPLLKPFTQEQLRLVLAESLKSESRS